MLIELLRLPLAVDEEYTARLYIVDHLVALEDVGRIMTCNKVSLVDVVRALDRLVAETEV